MHIEDFRKYRLCFKGAYDKMPFRKAGSEYDKNIRKCGCYVLIVLASIINIPIVSAQQTIIPEGASKVWGYVDNVAIAGLVEGPATADVELQIVCVFEYVEGDIFNSPPALPASLNGMVHLDEALKGKITEIRKTGKFKGEALSTFVIIPPNGSIKAKKLLLIGLGNRNNFIPDVMTSVGEVAAREAMKLKVKEFAVASDLKDAGIDSPTALVAENITKGIIEAIQTENYLKAIGLSDSKIPTKVYLLAGSNFFTTAGQGIQKMIDQNNN